MENKAQVAAYIRFHLEQLSPKNGHHDFEHLCRALARERICSNIIPASGPVSAGGDKGKDFETFTTYLKGNTLTSNTFIGLVSDKPVTFACSIERKNRIISKIKSDVLRLMNNSGKKPVSIFFFSVADIPISKREVLKKWAEDTFTVILEILDGQAISEMLADRDIFWIAAEYLHLSSDIYPRAAVENEQYVRYFNRWLKESRTPQNYADFIEIKYCGRIAKEENNVKQDLPRWIELLNLFKNRPYLPELRRKAQYEIAVLAFRGLGTLIGQEESLREYFADIHNITNTEEFEDFSVLSMYCAEACSENRVRLELKEINDWHKEIVAEVEKKLRNARTPNQKCPLLEIRGFLSLQFDPQRPELFDCVNAIQWWVQLMKIAKDAPLFPLERFSDRLTSYASFLGKFPEYEYLTHQTDAMLAERSGGGKAAEKCRDRAAEFLKIEAPLKAINELHKAKISWFAQETLEESIHTMFVISQAYLQIGLNYAAKYYALAAGALAVQSSDPELKLLLPRSIVLAAECDYAQGSWAGYLELSELGLAAFEAFGQEKSKDTIDEFEQICCNITTIAAITSLIDNSGLADIVKDKIKQRGLETILSETLQSVTREWQKRELSEIWTLLENQLWGRPFGDLGKERSTTWYELGIKWNVTWENNYTTTSIAEQFCAILQILLADFADIDLCLLKMDVKIKISCSIVGEIDFKSLDQLSWEVSFPLSQNLSANDCKVSNEKILAVAIAILSEVSLLPQTAILDRLKDLFMNGLPMKTLVARPYEELFRTVTKQETFDSLGKSKLKIPQAQRAFRIKDNPALPWKNSPVGGHSRENSIVLLEKRYRMFAVSINLTLKKLKNSVGFMAIVNKLRKEGWLDWHILAAISTIAVNYRYRKIFDPYENPSLHLSLFNDLMKQGETEDSIEVPLSEFNEENIRLMRKMNMIAIIKNLGLIPPKVANIEAIEDFLQHRYNYWTDDIPHSDPFTTNFSQA